SAVVLSFPLLFDRLLSPAPPPTEIYTRSLHDALPICVEPATEAVRKRLSCTRRLTTIRAQCPRDGHLQTEQPSHRAGPFAASSQDRKSTRLNSSHVKISYAVFCLKTKTYAT